MGVFDLRCALSGLSTWHRGSTCSMFLVEEVGGLHVPVLLPLSGTYDRYGRVEGSNPWLADLMDEWWGDEFLTSPHRDLMRHEEELGIPAMFLAAASSGTFNGYTLKLDGNAARPCLYRDDVARAIIAAEPCSEQELQLLSQLRDDHSIEVYADWLEQHGRPIQAMYERRHLARGIGLENANEFRALIKYMEPRGGFKPFTPADAGQHSYEELDQYAQRAWDEGSPPIRALLQRWLDQQPRPEVPFAETPTELAYAATPVTLEMVSSPAVAASPHRDQILRVLGAPRLTNPAVLAEMAGKVSLGDDVITILDDNHEVAHELHGRNPIVADGVTVVAGTPLTEGEPDDVHQLLRILGPRAVHARLVAQLRPLLELGEDALGALVMPMFDHLLVEGFRMTEKQFSSWVETGVLEEHHIHGENLLSSYAALATHSDPSLDAIIAEKHRREDLPRVDPDGYVLELRR